MKALSLVLVMFTTTVMAGVTDVDFMPEAGNLYYKAGIATKFGERKETVTTTIENKEQSSLVQTNSMTFGLFQNFEIGLEMDITIKDETNIQDKSINGVVQTPGVNFADDDINNSGLQDPFFKARYRMPLPSAGGFNLDIFGGFSPSIGDAERGDSSVTTQKNLEGNAYWGGHRLRLGAGINQDIDQFQWSLNISAQMNFTREFKDLQAQTIPPSHSLFEIDSYNDFKFEAKVLFEMIDSIHILGRLAFNFLGEQDWINQSNTTQAYIQEGHSDIELGLHGYWNFTQSFSARLGVDYTSIGENDLKFVQNGSVNTLFTSRTTDANMTSVSAGIDFTF